MDLNVTKNVVFARKMTGLIQAQVRRGNWNPSYYDRWDNDGFIKLLRLLNEEDNVYPEIREQVVENHVHELIATMEHTIVRREHLTASKFKELVAEVTHMINPDNMILKLRKRERGLLALLEEQSWGVVQDDLRAKQKASMK